MRFQTLLKSPVPGIFSILIITRTLNLFLPWRTGETYRLLACHQRSSLGRRKVLVAIGAENLIEIYSFVVIAVWTLPLIWPRVPGFLGPVLLIVVLLSRRTWITATALTLFSDLTDAAIIGCCLAALGVELGPLKWCLVLVTINLSTLLPVPGNLGTLEAGAVFGLAALGVNQTTALAFAILYRAAHLLPITGSSLISIIVAAARREKFVNADRLA